MFKHFEPHRARPVQFDPEHAPILYPDSPPYHVGRFAMQRSLALFPQLKDHRVDPLDCHGIERLVQKTGHCLKPNLMGSADCGPTIKTVPAPSGTSSLDYGLSVHPGWGRSFRDHLNGQLWEVWLCNEVVMDTAEHCREQLKKVQKAPPLAKSDAEATVLKNLARSWKMIANQMALYEQLQAEKKEVRPAPEQT